MMENAQVEHTIFMIKKLKICLAFQMKRIFVWKYVLLLKCNFFCFNF